MFISYLTSLNLRRVFSGGVIATADSEFPWASSEHTDGTSSPVE